MIVRIVKERDGVVTVDELIRHALKALKGCVQGDSVGAIGGSEGQKLTKENCSVAIVGVDQAFKELTEEELAPYVEAVSVYRGLFQETGLRFSQYIPIHVHCVFQRIEVRVLLHLAEMLEGRVFLLLHLRFWLHRVEVLLQLYALPSIRTHTLCVVPISTLPQLPLVIILHYDNYADNIQCRLLGLERDFRITDGYASLLTLHHQPSIVLRTSNRRPFRMNASRVNLDTERPTDCFVVEKVVVCPKSTQNGGGILDGRHPTKQGKDEASTCP